MDRVHPSAGGVRPRRVHRSWPSTWSRASTCGYDSLLTDSERGIPADVDGVLHALMRGTAFGMTTDDQRLDIIAF